MRVVMLGASLLTAVTLLASASVAQAQGGGYPGAAPSVGPDRNAPTSPQACGGNSRLVCSSNNQGGVMPACAAYRGSIGGWCGGLTAGYGGCNNPFVAYNGLPSGNRTYSRYQSSQNSPFFAPGGEAYSYAGYGHFSPLGYGAGANSPNAAYETTGVAGCMGTASDPAVLPAGGSTTPEYPSRAPDGR